MKTATISCSNKLGYFSVMATQGSKLLKGSFLSKEAAKYWAEGAGYQINDKLMNSQDTLDKVNHLNSLTFSHITMNRKIADKLANTGNLPAFDSIVRKLLQQQQVKVSIISELSQIKLAPTPVVLG